MNKESYHRPDDAPPICVADWGWKYHHTGIPTTEIIPNEKHIPNLKMYVSGFDKSPFGVEWMRFERDSPIHPLIKQVPHIAFEVDNLDDELTKRDFKILTPPTQPSKNVKVAMILHNGAPVELIEFVKQN